MLSKELTRGNNIYLYYYRTVVALYFLYLTMMVQLAFCRGNKRQPNPTFTPMVSHDADANPGQEKSRRQKNVTGIVL